MLIPNIIPQEEPQINVGIILPEDNIKKLSLKLPSNLEYQLSSDDQLFDLEADSILKLKYDQNTTWIEFAGTKHSTKNELKIIPKQIIKPAKQSGIKVSAVIAGRGFHWQKYIDVYLPDTIIFKIFEHSLTLINQLPLEHYVMCVATSEMSAVCPEAMIEAQTITARSWLLANVEQKHRHMEMDICNDDCCQRYQGTSFLSKQSINGALNTSGQVLMYKNQICDARYSKSCGGMMETFGTVWPGNEEDYLQAIPDSKTKVAELQIPLNEESNFKNWINSVPETFCSPKVIQETDLKKYLGTVDEAGEYFRWHLSVSQQELIETIYTHSKITATAVTQLEVISRGFSGRINKLNIHYLDQNGVQQIYVLKSEYNVRRFLAKKFLFSSAITITPVETIDGIPQSFEFNGAGWGHGVGLCQIGALGMALNNFPTNEILFHYYPGSALIKIY